MSSFWDNVFAGQQAPAAAPAAQTLAWWQDEQRVVQQYQQPQAQQYQQVQQAGPTQQDIQKIRKKGHQNISAEEADLIAEYDLATKQKYMNVCDQCGSGNFIPAGTRVAGVVMPTNKCFNCGNSARSPEPAVGGGSGQGSIHTRQIDTGGGGGNMFGVLSGVPRSYMPRN